MPMKSRRLLTAIMAVFVFFAGVLASTDSRAGPAILIDVDSGEVLFAHRAFDRWHPASITKLMTAYVAFSALRAGQLQPDSPVLISQNALSNPPSKMGFPVGTRITLSSALKMLIVKSANDIAVAIGETVSGSEPAFVSLMNSTAQRLGMTSSRFVNPHGLHDRGQYTTARDMAVLARAILREFPEYQFLFSIPGIRVGKRVLRSHNRLIGRYPGATGMKTGYICAGGYNLVASAKRGNKHLIAVVLGAPNGSYRALVAAHMLENGFDRSRGFFSGRPTMIESFRGSGRKPVDMRPYICKPKSQRQPIPREIASFGFDVPIVDIGDDPDDQEDSGFNSVSGKGAAAIQISSGSGGSRAQRIAAYLSGPRQGSPVSANGLLPKDELATMSMPRTIPAPPRRPTIASATALPAVETGLQSGSAVELQAVDPAVAGMSVPMPRRKPAH